MVAGVGPASRGEPELAMTHQRPELAVPHQRHR